METKKVWEILEKIRHSEYLNRIITTNRLQIQQAQATMVAGRDFWLYQYVELKEKEIKWTIEDLQRHRKKFITYLESL